MAEHFGTPLAADAQEELVARFARAWLWQLVAGFLFPNSSGYTISWMWLEIIGQDWDNIGTFNWRNATLLDGCTVKCVMLVGGVEIMQTLAVVLIYCSCGCGSAFLLAGGSGMLMG